MKKRIIDDVEVTEDENGNMHFAFVDKDDQKEKKETQPADDRSWLQRVIDWLKSESSIYVKVGDKADPCLKRRDTPEDQDVGSDGAPTVEVGWKWKF